MQIIIAKEVSDYSVRTAFDRPVYFIDFDLLLPKEPIVYISMVRDPVSMVIESYYTNRSADSGESLDHCVAQGRPECILMGRSNHEYRLIPHFCGHDPRCLQANSEWALRRAIKNIKISYPVIGVTELMNTSIAVLEIILPEYFSGAAQVLEKLKRKSSLINYTIDRHKLTQSTVTAIRNNLTQDYELYEFIVKRIREQSDILYSKSEV